jgi:hypothetical protein
MQYRNIHAQKSSESADHLDMCTIYFLYTVRDAWIGINDRATEGEFRNMVNQAVHLTMWASGEPNDGDISTYPGPGDCVRITGGKFRDSACSRILPAVCSKELQGNTLFAPCVNHN